MKLQATALLALATLAPAALAQFSSLEWDVFHHLQGIEYSHTQKVLVDGDAVQIHGIEDAYCWPSQVWVQTVAPVDGHVSFTGHYTNPGPVLTDYAPVVVLDGAFLPPPGSSYPTGDYPFAFDVNEGQSFGFGVAQVISSCSAMAGILDVSDFQFVPKTWFEVGGSIDPRPWLDVPAPPAASGFGKTLGACGDLDGDGIGDLAVGDPARGHLFAISGADGAVLLDLVVLPSAEMQVTGAGDFDGDGQPDLLVGLPLASVAAAEAGRIEVYSGLDGSLLAAYDGAAQGYHLGASVAAAGDTNGDGFADLVAGAPGGASEYYGHAVLLGGPDAHLLHELGTGHLVGKAVAGLGDADGDGVPDVAVSGADGYGPEYSSVAVHSGATGQLISTAIAYDEASTVHLAPMGDIDGDGLADFVWGLPHDYLAVPFAGGEGPGYFLVCSGATGEILASWHASSSWGMIGDVVASGDWNGDGIMDAAFAKFVGDDSGYGVSRRLQIVSGAPGHELLHEMKATGADDFACALATPGDLDGDGVADLAIGAPGDSIGVRFVHALDGHGTPRLHATGDLVPGGAFTLMLTQCPTRTPVALVAGPDRLDLPLKGGLLVPSIAVIVPLFTDPTGAATIETTWPSGIPGPFSFWMQAWMPDPDAPHGFGASNGLGGLQP